MNNDEREKYIDDLVQQTQGGDANAFAKLYDCIVSEVYRYIFYRVQRQDVEDLTELVFLKVWENIRKYQKEGVSFRAWVFKIAHNLLIDHYRIHRSILHLDERLKDTSKESDPIHHTEISLNNGLLVKALSQLKRNHREILILKFINELNNIEIARVLNKREGSIRVLQFRALRSLRKELHKIGVTWL